MNIVILVKNYQHPWNEGVKVNIRAISERLNKKGHKISFISIADKDAVLDLNEGRAYLIGTPFYRSALRYLFYPMGFIRLLLKGRNIVKQINPDIFIVSFGTNALIASCLRKISGIRFKIVQFFYSDWYYPVKVPLKVFFTEHLTQFLFNNRFFTALTIRHCDLAIATANYIKEELRSIARGGTRIIYIPTGVNCDYFSPQKNIREKYKEPFVVGFIGHATYSKGLGVAWEAVKPLLKDFNIRFLCAISHAGAESVLVESLRNEKGALQVFGTVNQRDFYNSVDLIIYPLRFSFGTVVYPNIVLEASACATPVVVTDLPGTREFIKHKDNGYLLEYPDAALLRDLLLKLLKDTNALKTIAAASRNNACLYDWKNITEKLERELINIL